MLFQQIRVQTLAGRGDVRASSMCRFSTRPRDCDGIHLKFEILLEGRIDLVGAMDPKLDVPALRVDDTATLREGLRILGTLPRE